MSTPTIPTAQEVQDQVRAALRKGQEAALEAIKAFAGAVSSIAPKIPAAISDFTRPLAEALPKPETVVAKVHDLAEKARTEQRKLAEEALKATAALRPAARAAGESAGETAAQAPQEPPAE
jgi:transketolase